MVIAGTNRRADGSTGSPSTGLPALYCVVSCDKVVPCPCHQDSDCDIGDTMAQNERPKRVTPPYATPAGLRLFFDKIRKVRPPQLTTKWAEDNELPFADAIVNTMKFLNAVDKDGNLLPVFQGLRLEGEDGQKALEPLVRAAYAPIFEQIDDIEAISEQDLNNAFKTAYDVGTPGRYVRPFLTLCELAGMRTPSDDQKPATVRRRTTTQQGAQGRVDPGRAERRAAAENKGDRKRTPSHEAAAVQVILRLDIPWDAPIEEVRARVRAIRDLSDEAE